MRRRDMFWYTTGVVIGRVVVAGRVLVGRWRAQAKVPVGRGHRI